MAYKGYPSYDAYRRATDTPEYTERHDAALEAARSDPNRTPGSIFTPGDPTGIGMGDVFESYTSDPQKWRTGMVIGGALGGLAGLGVGAIGGGTGLGVEAGTGLVAAPGAGITAGGAGLAGAGVGATEIGSGLSVGLGTSTTPAIGSGLSLAGLTGEGAVAGAGTFGSLAGAGKYLGPLLSGATSLYGSKMASDAAGEAAGASLQAQREQLAYLREVDALPRQFREEALARRAGAAGLEGGIGTQQEAIERARQSPLYGALIGGREAGEEAILRQASATGGLRSGNVQEALYDYNVGLENRALLESYGRQQQELQGLSGLPTQTTNIANIMGGMGQTEAQRIQAQGQAWQQGLQGLSTTSGQALGDYFSRQTGGSI